MAQYPENFIALGSQYGRFPTPTREKWEKDMRAMVECGFDPTKLATQWRTDCPKEGVYDFSDVECLMDLARENGLRAIINTFFDGAPTWFTHKYPYSLKQTCDGRTVYPKGGGLAVNGRLARPLL